MVATHESITAPARGVERRAVVASRVKRFPTREDVSAAVSMFAQERNPETAIRTGRVVLIGEASEAHPLRTVLHLRASECDTVQAMTGKPVSEYVERLLNEGAQWRIEVAPGMIGVRRTDPARAHRAAERAIADRKAAADVILSYLQAGEEPPEPAPGRTISVWSGRSRSRMLLRLSELDYASAGFGEDRWIGLEHRVGMVTLTYPGDWLAVAPSAQVTKVHLDTLRRRWARRWGPLAGVWKREFQRRGAPHFHIGGLLPVSPDLIPWLSEAWADIVGASTECKGYAACPCAEGADPLGCICSERALHTARGTGVDWAKGARSSDPRRFAHYFGKHGIASVKEYQNEAPSEWAEDVSIGRFWGVWNLKRLTLAVHVAPDTAQSLARTARRWFAAQGARQSVYRWRKVTTVDAETGELGWKWRKRKTAVPIRRLSQSAGYLVCNDGPALAAALAVAVDRQNGARSGRGPMGFLP